MWVYLISEIPWSHERRLQRPHREPDPGRSQAPGADPAPARRSAGHQPERDQPDREGPPEPLAGDAGPDRCRPGLRDRRARGGPDPPAGDRADHALGLDRGQDLQERRRRPALRLAAQPRPDPAAQGGPHRGGEPAAGGPQQPGRADPLAQHRQRPRDHPAGRARPRAHRRGGRPAYPLGDHVPRPPDAPLRGLRAAVRRRLQPRHPHRAAPHGRAPAVRAGDQGQRRRLPRDGQPQRSSRSGRSC